MSKTSWLSLLVLAAVLCGSATGQETAQIKTQGALEVKAGDTINFEVVLDKAPSVKDITVSVSIGPKDPSPVNGSGGSGSPTDASRTHFRVSLPIPATAQSGVWHVTAVALNFPGGNKTLKFPETDFSVRENEKLVLPDSATLAVVK